jgi:MarR family transcriptional regulator, 2-MHQ and catechol-resistance regulon repressor
MIICSMTESVRDDEQHIEEDRGVEQHERDLELDPAAEGVAGLDPDAFGGCPSTDGLAESDRQAITLMGLLVEAHARLVRALGAEMEEACMLPLSWYDAMIRLRRSPGGFTTMSRLGSEVSLTSGGITRLVDRLVEAGYVERRNCPNDRRVVYVSLTPAGVAKVDEATAAHREGLDRHLLAPLDSAERAALERALRKLRGSLAAPER